MSPLQTGSHNILFLHSNPRFGPSLRSRAGVGPVPVPADGGAGAVLRYILELVLRLTEFMRTMRTLSSIRQVVVPVIAVILIYGALWGCQPVQQSGRTLVPVTPSPTWVIGSITLTATQVTPVTGSHMETPDGETGGTGSHRELGQPTPAPHPEKVKRGQRLFYAVGCFQCHGVKAEGAVGPRIARTDLPLDAVMNQVYQPVGDMPAFSVEGVSKSDVAAIYAYLQSLEPTEPRPEITADRPDSAAGEALYRYFGCFGCHGYQAEGGFGPRLAGTQLSLEELRTQMRELRSPQGRMPAFGPGRISDEEFAHIYAFLQSVALTER